MGDAIPQPGQWMDPVAEARLEPLRGFYAERVKPHVGHRPEMQRLCQAVESALSGRSFQATKAWEESAAGQSSDCSYLRWTETNPLGSCTAREVEAWRRDFTSQAAVRELSNHQGRAHVPEPFLLEQRDVGQARGPSFRDDILTEAEMKEALVQHCVDIFRIGEARVVQISDWRAGELILWMFAQFTASDVEHKKPRWVLNFKWANEPAKSTRHRRKKRSGAPASRASTTPQDLAVVMDAMKGYKQVGITDAAGRKQRYIIPMDVFRAACAKLESLGLEAPWPTHRTRVEVVGGVMMVVLQPTALQFGGATSSDIFCDRLGLPIAQLRQAGFRIESQIDDMELKSRHGPATLLVETMIMMLYMSIYGWMMHASGEKATQSWPRSVWTFDGVELRARDLMVFTPTERDKRHRDQLRRYRDDDAAGVKHSLRQYSEVLGQQVSHRQIHYPTALVLPTATAFLARECRRLAAEHGVMAAWDKPVQSLPEVVRADMLQLLEPRTVGEHMRAQNGVALATVTVDASGFAAGYLIEDHRDGKKTSGTMTMRADEREKHHTVQECELTARVGEMAVKHLDLWATDTPAASTILMRNDNTAGVKNLSKPGSKPQMVEPTVAFQVIARMRGLYPIAAYIDKYFMDVLSRVDFMSRPTFHYGDLGLDPEVVALASSMLRVQIQGMVDGAACRATKQPAAADFVTRYPSLGAMRKPDIRSYDLGEDPELRDRVLYLFPPEILLADLIWKLQAEPRRKPTLLVVPHWEKTPAWWPVLLPMIEKYVTVPFNKENYVQPGAPEVIVDPPRWPLTICSLWRSGSEIGESQTRARRRPQSSEPMWMGEVDRSSLGEISQSSTTRA